MKRTLSIIIAALMLLALAAAPAAAIEDNEWEKLKVTQLVQVSTGINYADNEDLEYGKQTMRGFAVSPDGTRLFGGFLNPGNSSALVMFDTMTSRAIGYYVYYQPLDQKTSYPKGLDVDDRGYCYVGLAYYPNNGVANMAILKYDEKDNQTGFLKEVSVTELVHEADPGTGTKVGVNGLKVKAVGNGYYAYVVINYEVDYLYRFNVTNPETPVLDATFGEGGRMVLGADAFKIEGQAITEGNYLDVDDDGTIYLAATTESGQYLLKISDDGRSVLGYVAQRKAYGVAVWEDKVICSSQNSPHEIIVYRSSNFEKVAQFTIAEENVVIPGGSSIDHISYDPINSICTLKVAAGCLFFCDQGSGSGDCDQIFMAALNADGAAFEKTVSDSIEATFKSLDTTEEETTAAEPEPTTDEETTAGEPETTTAAAEPEATTAEEVKTPEVTTAAKEPEKKGCGSSVAGIALLIPVCAAVLTVKRKKD